MVDEKQKESSTDNIGNGDKPKVFDKVERAELAVQRMEEIEKRLDEKTAKLQELEANRLLSGTAGGHIETIINEEDLKKKQAMDFWKGTAIADAIDKTNG
jgi:capsule polysaccharide export protein KpsE/RkpR